MLLYYNHYYSPIPYPLVASPFGSNANLYTWSLTSKCLMHPFIPFETGSFSVNPVVFPGPPINNGSLNVILEKRPLLLPCTCFPLFNCNHASHRCRYRVMWFHWFKRTVSSERTTPTPEPQSNLKLIIVR